jgi:putative FmdB family regulatory protein
VPTYEYACKSCGEHIEVVQSFRDDPLTTCSNCGGELRKVFGSIGIAFKGSGFYRTDSRKPPSEAAEKKPAAKSDAKADAKADGKGDGKATKSDTKAAASS